MRHRTALVIAAVLIAAITLASYMWPSPLARFSGDISDADRAVVTLAGMPTLTISITGDRLRSLMHMVSSARRDQEHYACSTLGDVQFLHGSMILGEMRICERLMWIKGRQYRDDTEALDSLIVRPLKDALDDIPQGEASLHGPPGLTSQSRQPPTRSSVDHDR